MVRDLKKRLLIRRGGWGGHRRPPVSINVSPPTIVAILMVLFIGCVAAPVIVPECPRCPVEDYVIFSPWTGAPVLIKRGFFNNPDNCYLFDEFKREAEEYRREYEEGLRRREGVNQ